MVEKEILVSNLDNVMGAVCGSADPAPACGTKDPE